ncbi:NAD(P)H-dependent glycerol-3-phosphate dehydrogenase [Trujillonella humicola]|uniref:NAD(P)H-dependent glycerol-3-phosphate dehydrogenase n=1 Tax=Trujillonella humicola TaxID=3383699 RepID=UPI0039062A01
MRVTVLGAGAWGTTVAALVAGRHDTVLWARDPETAREVDETHVNARYLPGSRLPEGLRATADLERAVRGAELLVVGVPTHGFRQVLTDLRPWLGSGVPVVSLSKGLEEGSLLRMTQVVEDVLPGHPPAALSGPNLAREVIAGLAAASVLAAADPTLARGLQSVLRRGLFRIYTNHDVIGCELGGALKNVVAIATGIAQGLSVGDNTRASVMTRGLAELTRLSLALGGEATTMAGLAGMGDLIATCMSPLSRNRGLGERLGAGEPLADVVAGSRSVFEGVRAAHAAQELAGRCGVEMPVCHEVHRVLSGEIPASAAYRGLQRHQQAGHEAEPG